MLRVLVLLVLVIAAASGCVTSRDEGQPDEQPWSTPAGWESDPVISH